MSFHDFLGNAEKTAQLRRMLQSERLPHAIIIAGARGAGKYTLAQMMAKTMVCQNPQRSDGLPDFCGACNACLRVAEADDLEARCAEAAEVRETVREARDVRILIQTHPDVLIIPPDPPQMMIKVDQVRRVTESLALRPAEGKKKVYIFTDSALMKEAANALLKALEEPPEFAHFFLLTTNSGELLPTIRSRCVTVQLSPLSFPDLEAVLAKRRPELKGKQREFAARLSEGAVGRALNLDLAAYVEVRSQALVLLTARDDHSPLFQATERFRSGADGAEKMKELARVLFLLLEDLMFLLSSAEELVRNVDMLPQLKGISSRFSFEQLARAAQELNQLESGMRRNLLRGLALDSFAVSLEA